MAVITPDRGDKVLNKSFNQIYPIVNELFKEATGIKDIEAVDTNSYIAMGKTLQQLGGTEKWLNTLARRIGMTLEEYRPYKSKFSDLARNQMEWGAIVQKIEIDMPDAVADKTWDVGKMDGQSVDQWIINNPSVHQVFFDNESGYSFFITTQTKLLKRAFLNEGAMMALITGMYGKVQNKIEITHENLARIAIANLVGNMGTTQEFHLVTMYNSASNRTLNTNSAKYDADFIRYACSIFNNVSWKFENMTVQYNTEGRQKFTPVDKQKMYVLADFVSAISTVPQYLEFARDSFLSRATKVPYWQGNNTDTDLNDWMNISSIKVTNKDGQEVHANNLVAVLFDREACGTFRQDSEVLTTPVNARARYYNTFWHEDQFWFNMTDENAVAFYLD